MHGSQRRNVTILWQPRVIDTVAHGSKAISKMFSNIFTEKNLQKSGLRQFKPVLFRGQKISSPESSQACAALWRAGDLVYERNIIGLPQSR